MSSSENPKTKTDSQGDVYEAAVLDFLNKELEAARQPNERSEQSEELDTLVADLLKQVITESDQQKDIAQSVPGEPHFVMSGPMLEPKEAYPPGNNLLANLNRGLSQTYSEKDLWDSEYMEAQPSVMAGQPDSETQLAAKAVELPPSIAAKENQSRPLVVPGEVKTEGRRFSPHGDILFKPALMVKRNPPLAVIASIGLLIVIGGGVYSFLSSTGSSSKNQGVAVGTSASNSAANENLVVIPPPQAEIKGATTAKAPPPATKTIDEADTSKPAAAGDVRRQSAPGKDAQAPAVQQPANHSRENAASIPPPTAVVPAEARVDIEEGAMPDRSTAAPQPVPLQAAASVPALDKATAPTTLGNAIAANGTGEKTPFIQPVALVPIKTENSTLNSIPLPAVPAQSRVLIPPAPLLQPSPSYPEIALRSRTSGSVVLDLQIDEKGRVAKATPVSGPAMFHAAAVAAALRWQYRPASIDGINVPSQAKVTISFNLNK